MMPPSPSNPIVMNQKVMIGPNSFPIRSLPWD